MHGWNAQATHTFVVVYQQGSWIRVAPCSFLFRGASLQKITKNPAKMAGVLKDRWLKRTGNSPLEACLTAQIARSNGLPDLFCLNSYLSLVSVSLHTLSLTGVAYVCSGLPTGIVDSGTSLVHSFQGSFFAEFTKNPAKMAGGKNRKFTSRRIVQSPCLTAQIGIEQAS